MARLFGTNGIRWMIGEHAPDFPVTVGVAVSRLLGEGCTLAVGMDTRTSSEMVFHAFCAGAMSAGCNVIDLGVVPTPLVQYAIREMRLGGGVMVTASHNPPEFNGLKVFANDGTELSRADEEMVEGFIAEGKTAPTAWDKVGKMRPENHVQELYRNSIVSFTDLKAKGLKAVVDCANGTAPDYTPVILTNIGCSVSTINSQQDGRFPGRMPEPVRENLAALMSAVKAQGASLGIAHDGDSDRATFVDERGNFVTGDQSLSLFAADALRRRGPGTIVIPVTTSGIVEEVVTRAGGKIEYTPVGSPIIARRMMENGAILGGEGNGGTLFPEHQYCRDGIMAAARMSEIVSMGSPLSELVSELPEYFTMSAKVRASRDVMPAVMQKVRGMAEGDIIEVDGVKCTFDDHWYLIRASGTEPIIRITVDSKSRTKSEAVLARQLKALDEIVRGLS